MIRNPSVRILSFLFIFFLVGCEQINSVKTSIPSTPTIVVTETPITIPTVTLIPSPTSAPAYSYAPVISAENIQKVEKLDSFTGGVSSLAISPNGYYLAATFENGTGIIWDISNVKYLGDWRDAPKDIFMKNGPISFNSESNILATGGTLLELPSKEVYQEFQETIVFNPINNTYALFDWKNISIRNLKENTIVWDIKQESAGVVDVVFSPDGNLLGEALDLGRGEGVNIWRISDQTLLFSFPPVEHGHPAHFNSFAFAYLAFSPDNQFIATGTRDEPSVRVWNLQTGELVVDLSTVVQTGESEFYVPDVDCVSFTQDSKVIAIAANNTIIFKRISDGEFITMLKIDSYSYNSSKYITSCVASNDGKILVTGDSDGDISIWGIITPVP